MKICSPVIMLNLEWPIQCYSQQFAYVFMLVVCHHLYLLRAHASLPQQGIVFSLPCPSGLSWHSSELCPFNRLPSVPGPRMKTMLLFLYLFGIVWIFFLCFGSYACTDTSEYIDLLKEEGKANLPLSFFIWHLKYITRYCKLILKGRVIDTNIPTKLPFLHL